MVESYDCKECEESLYGQKYILKEENPYCIKCYETLFSSDCESCHKLIGCTSKMQHKDRSWHENCFACNRCQQPIRTRSFVQKEANHYCLPCYEKQFALQCSHCRKVRPPATNQKPNQPMSKTLLFAFYESRRTLNVGFLSACEQPITTGGVNYRDQPWHKECFVCIGCKQQLAGQRFTSRDDFTYCLSCFCNLFTKKCAYCTSPISGLGGSKYISFEQRQWHNDCFNCKKCSVSLVGRGFLTSKDDILCPDCGKDL
uniref:Four and a half LIM domains protein 2-like n=1 Tax=Gouania willdenowi TaxID=441366 RepID=A0A8C5GJN0_GOUWI